MSKAKITPLGDRVLVRHVDDDEQVKGGIIIPDSAKEKPQEAEVVALGTGKKDDDGNAIGFQVKKEHIIWTFLACLITYFGSTFSNMFLGPIAGAFMAGTIAALCSGIFSRVLNLPIVLFLLPSIIILVPGSVGFKALNMLFDKNIIEGIRSIFHTASIGIALVSGIYVGSIFIKPRRTL